MTKVADSGQKQERTIFAKDYFCGRDKAGLREALDGLYTRFNRTKYIPYDPIKYVHRFRDEAELELVALIVSSLSFGRVSQIFLAVDRLFQIMENEPLHYVLTLGSRPEKDLLSFQYRFVTGSDIFDFLACAGKIINDHGSIGRFAEKNHERGSIMALADQTIQTFQSVHYLVPNTLKNSACKRLFMFFRWMVRHDNVDLGLWRFIDPRDLVIPLDTHIAQVSKMLGFTSRKSPSLKTAMEITDNLRKYSGNDPVKYDWPLSHIGIIQNNFPDALCLVDH